MPYRKRRTLSGIDQALSALGKLITASQEPNPELDDLVDRFDEEGDNDSRGENVHDIRSRE